jgi:hypothetical protein
MLGVSEKGLSVDREHTMLGDGENDALRERLW